MNRFLFTIMFLVYIQPVFSQITGAELLEKTIACHDPENEWPQLSARFLLEQTRPDRPSRKSELILKNGEDYCKITEEHDGSDIIVREIRNHSGTVTVNGSENFSQEISDKYWLSHDRILRTRNYYIYLYGLPMKLRDPGTIVRDEVKTVLFDGKEYLELGITYGEGVGTDNWFFYINPDTYAMEGYKFYQESGNGEFITMEGLSSLGGIKIPKVRKWHTTKDSTFLGADILTKVELIR